MKNKLSSILIGLLNILLAILIMQINQYTQYIDYVHIIGLNIKIEILILPILILPIILNIVFMITKKSKVTYIVCSLESILMALATILCLCSLATQLENVWNIVVAISIIILAIIYVAIILNSQKKDKPSIVLNAILILVLLIIGLSIYGLYYIKSQYKNYVVEQKKTIANNNKEYVELYLVKKDQKFGYIDVTGKEVIPCEYDEVIVPFNKNNVTALKRGQDIKILNNKNQEIIAIGDKCGTNFVKKLANEISTKYEKTNKNYKENRYLVLEQINENLYQYNDQYNLYYNRYYDYELGKEVCDCRLKHRETGLDYLILDTQYLPSEDGKLYIYNNYNIPFVNDTSKGYYTTNGTRYAINSENVHAVHFEGADILFKKGDHYVFNSLQEKYEYVYILDNIYIVKLEDGTYKVLDKLLETILSDIKDVKICENIVIYSKDNKKYGMINKQGEIIFEPKYDLIDEPETYENKLVEQLEIMYSK